MIDMGLLARIQPLAPETFNLFRTLIMEKSSINIREGKIILVSNRLRKRLLALKLTSYEDYYTFLTEDPAGERELQKFIDAVSTNETHFYREHNHLLAMQDHILPQLLPRTDIIRIWSAGCSTGEEPYTIKIALKQYIPSSWKGKVEITATDINDEVIQKAREGIYRDRSLRLVPPAVLASCFQSVGDGAYQVKSAVKDGMSFRVHNLLADEPPGTGFDFIFCRNVMIYFNKETQKRLVDCRFASALHPEGYLFIGHSESLTGVSERFTFLRGFRVPVYRLATTGSAARTTPGSALRTIAGSAARTTPGSALRTTPVRLKESRP